MNEGRPSGVAIVGMSCRFAGANDLSTYWENILAGKDCTREVPPGRWAAQAFCDPLSGANDRVPSSRGGYLEPPIYFDAAAHGIMPRTVEGGEPEQFLVLEAAAAALSDAGLAAADLRRKKVEVVIGRGNYFNRGNLTRLQHGRMVEQVVSLLWALHPEWPESRRDAIRTDLKASLPPFEAATIPGQLTNATAGRLAHRLDLDGASFVVDAASASSLVALDLAVRALRDRRANLAIVGAVYLEADVDFPLVFRQLNALSPSGTSRPFAADADGMLPGEGVGVLILKRKADAERDGDRIYAVIRGIGIASDGRSHGLAAPSARGHARAIRRAYRAAGIDPSTVMLVEGHGLGVGAADRAELRALNAVFPAPRYGRRALGAVSSMIGHAMPAAGMAGLIKTVLALYHRVLPPTLHAERPNPLLAVSEHSAAKRAAGSPKPPAFSLNGAARPWIHPDENVPRRAGVNAFGFAGINAHAVLEEHAASADRELPGGLRHWDSEAFLLSAPDRGTLCRRVQQLIDRLKERPSADLKDVAYTLNCVGEHPPESARLGLVAISVRELIERLQAVLPRLEDAGCSSIRDGRGAYYWEEPLLGSGPGGLAFLFPGEGSQYPGMLADLCLHFPEVVRRFDISDRIALELGETVPPSENLFGSMPQAAEQLWRTATAVNVVLSSQWAMYQVLTRLGLRPDAVAGHSSGELLALAAADVLRADRELERHLGRLGSIFRGFESSGEIPQARLVAVATARDRALEICREQSASEVVIAMDNCPHQVVLAGPPNQVERVVERMRDLNILWEILPFERAYHTPSFGAVLGPVEEFFAQLNLRPPRLPVYSCAARGRMPDDLASIRSLAIAQWTRTVAFRETIEAMHADGLRMFVDVGARGNLAGYVDDTLRGKPVCAMAANLPRRSGLLQLNHLVAAAFAQGAPVEPEFLYVRRRPCALDWNAPAPRAQQGIELNVGFPEMTLSQALLERIAAQPATHLRGGPSSDSAGIADAESELPPSQLPSRHGDDSLNGDAAGNTEPASATSLLAWPRYCFPENTADPTASPSDVSSAAERFVLGAEEHGSETAGEAGGAMLAFQETMRRFLHTQEEVMTAYWNEARSAGLSAGAASEFSPAGQGAKFLLDPVPENGKIASANEGGGGARSAETLSWTSPLLASGANPGPWVGTVLRLDPGVAVEAVLMLDCRDDPIADNHTLGGRRISALGPTRRGLPVLPFAIMAEMTAEAAALVVTPGLVVTKLEQVRAHRWVRYEAAPIHVELRGQRVSSRHDERVLVAIFNRGADGRAEAPRPVFEAIVIFESAPRAPAHAAPYELEDSRASRFTAESAYEEGWLFHGPCMQAMVEIGRISRGGIEGILRVMPWKALMRPGQRPALHIDAIILDSFTHLLGCWGLDWQADDGDVMFPLRMDELEIEGVRPAVGTDVACRIRIQEVERHRVRASAEIVRPDGSVWMRIRHWEDWRFRWPGRFRDAFRQAQNYFVGEELPLVDRSGSPERRLRAVWLSPPAEMGRPIWRDVLERTQLAPAELPAIREHAGSDRDRCHRLWGLVAAKEAGRRIWRSEGRPPSYPADLLVVEGTAGRMNLARADQIATEIGPAVSIAYRDGVAVALAACDPEARIGIEVEAIVEPPEVIEPTNVSPVEREILAHLTGTSRAEWAARLRCARRAALKALAITASADADDVEIAGVDQDTGEIHVKLSPACPRSQSPQSDRPLRIFSARRDGHVWAWALEEGAEPQ
jgi:acyl transferase domain-containing protein